MYVFPLAAIIAASLCTSTVSAGVIHRTDTYIGANPGGGGSTGSWDGKDRIGNNFEVSSAGIMITSQNITAEVDANYLLHVGQSGTELGDLFFDVFSTSNGRTYTWDSTDDGNPVGFWGASDDMTKPLNYEWSYALRLTGQLGTGASTGGVEVYEIDTANYNVAILSSNEVYGASHSGTYRNDQEVRVNASENKKLTLTTGSWSISGERLTISIDANNEDFLDLLGLGANESFGTGLKWGMTCANDTIELGPNSPNPPPPNTVPEPSTALAFGIGLLGAAVVRRRRKLSA